MNRSALKNAGLTNKQATYFKEFAGYAGKSGGDMDLTEGDIKSFSEKARAKTQTNRDKMRLGSRPADKMGVYKW